MSKSSEKAIHAHVTLSPEIERLITLATLDLYFGPIGPTDDDGNPWPGFEAACAAISDALDAVGDLWVADEWGCVLNSEPEWENPEDPDTEGENPHDWTHYEARDVKRILVGKELAGFI